MRNMVIVLGAVGLALATGCESTVPDLAPVDAREHDGAASDAAVSVGNDAAVSDAAVSGNDAAVNDAAVSGNDAAVNDAAVPGSDAAVSDAAVPGSDAAVPGSDAAVPGSDAAVPGSDAAVSDAAVPGSDAATSSDAAATADAAQPGCASVASVGAGGRFTCAVTTTGALYCWGLNENGRLGQGDLSSRLSPARVGSASDWTEVSLGLGHGCASRAGALWCWGSNASRQLGTGDTTEHWTPFNVAAGPGWQHLSMGALFSLGLRGNELWAWGSNSYGQTGIAPPPTLLSSPQQVGSSRLDVAGGMSHSCAIDVSGALFCSGFNNTGQLGLGDIDVHNTFTQVGTQTGWSDVDAALFHSCGIRNGELYCWGSNSGWVLGQAGMAQDQLQLTPLRVGTENDWVDVSVGEFQSCGIRGSGALYCWGYNADGRLGVGDVINREVPTQVGISTDWSVVDVSAQLHTFGGFQNQACGIRGGGELYCWGSNQEGQLGLGDLQNRLVPTAVCLP